MPFYILPNNIKEIPKILRITLGTFPVNVPGASNMGARAEEAVKKYKADFGALGIAPVFLPETFFDQATFAYYRNPDEILERKTKIYTSVRPLGYEEQCGADGTVVQFSHTLRMDSMFWSPELKAKQGVAAAKEGDYIEQEYTIINPGTVQLYYDIPLTPEAILACKPVLRVMEKLGLFSAEEQKTAFQSMLPAVRKTTDGFFASSESASKGVKPVEDVAPARQAPDETQVASCGL